MMEAPREVQTTIGQPRSNETLIDMLAKNPKIIFMGDTNSVVQQKEEGDLLPFNQKP